jgi:hypothetical protein
MVVGATGHLVSESRAGGRRSLRYQVESVHDFAWTAWPRFREQHERIDGVDVHLLYPPGHAHNARCTLDVLRQALPHFSARYGRYPYADLTVVHPPSAAANAGGMEYPTLITTGGAWHESHWSRAVEYVTAHELGHQWFYGLLASNERRWPFLDEGLNSYAEGVAVREFYGPASASSALGFPLSSEALRRFVMLSRPHDVPIAAAATEFPSLRDLGAVVYQRSALLLQTLANVYGEGALSAALSRYALRFRFQHPTPDDLLAVLGETLAPDALENLRAALFKGHTVDYELSSLESARLGPDPNNPSRELFESRALVSRHGELAFPVQVLLITEAGERITHTWDGRERFRSFTHRGPSRVAHALVDPELRVLIDENLLDNSRALHPALPLGPYATSVQLLYLLAGLVAP